MQGGQRVTEVQPPRLAGRRRAIAVQVLLGAWVAAVLIEMFVADAWFGLDLTNSNGSQLPLQWGIASTLIAVAIAATTIWWLAGVGAPAVRAVTASQRVGFFFGLWAGVLWLYVVSDITLAEAVRAELGGGPETRWPVLLSAGLGIAAAVIGIGLIRSVMSAVAARTRATSEAMRTLEDRIEKSR